MKFRTGTARSIVMQDPREEKLKAWRELCAATVIHGGLDVRFVAFEVQDSPFSDGEAQTGFAAGTMVVRAAMWVQDTKGAGMRLIRHHESVEGHPPHHDYLFAMARTLLEHELAEQFTVRGERVIDPHALPPLVATPKSEAASAWSALRTANDAIDRRFK